VKLKALTTVNIRNQPSLAGDWKGQFKAGDEVEVYAEVVVQGGYEWRQIVANKFWVAEGVKNGERYFEVVVEPTPDPEPEPDPPPEGDVILFNEIFSEDSEGGFWQVAQDGLMLDGGLLHFEVHVIRRSAASGISVVLYCEGEDIQAVRLVPGAHLWRGQG
jgi:hypothetical protein